MMSTGHEIAMSLRAAYLSLHRQTDACLAERGVTADQFVILAALAEQDAITQQEIVKRASSDPNTIRTMLVLLESRGLVSREPHPTDGRARSVTLTAEGRATYQRCWTALRETQNKVLAPFEADEARLLIEFLARISAALTPAKRRRPRRTAPPRVGNGRQEGSKG